jgi:hypothetical protein
MGALFQQKKKWGGEKWPCKPSDYAELVNSHKSRPSYISLNSDCYEFSVQNVNILCFYLMFSYFFILAPLNQEEAVLAFILNSNLS